jgi:hypothetical protein
LICFVVLSWESLKAQVFNVDREVIEDSSYKSWAFSAGLNISSDKQKKTILDVSSNLELNRFFKNRYVLVGALRNDAVFNGKDLIQNEGLSHLRFRDQDSRRFSWEAYLQYQWNGAWGMEYRYVAGNNLRIRIVEKSNVDFYLATGIFREWEKWNWSGVKDNQQTGNKTAIKRNMFRFNQYLKYAVKLSDQVDLSVVNYFQFPLTGKFMQPRWYMDGNLYINMVKNLSFMIHWDHIFDLNRVVPIDSFFYTFSTGVQLKIIK